MELSKLVYDNLVKFDPNSIECSTWKLCKSCEFFLKESRNGEFCRAHILIVNEMQLNSYEDSMVAKKAVLKRYLD